LTGQAQCPSVKGQWMRPLKNLLVDGLSKNRTLRQIPSGQRTQDTNGSMLENRLVTRTVTKCSGIKGEVGLADEVTPGGKFVIQGEPIEAELFLTQ